MKGKIKRFIASVLITTFVAGAANIPVSAEELFGFGKEKKQDITNRGINDCADGKILKDVNDLKVTYNKEPEKPEPHPEPVFDESEITDMHSGCLDLKERSQIIVKYKNIPEEDLRDMVKDNIKDDIIDMLKSTLKDKLKLSKLRTKKKMRNIEVLEISENDDSENLLKELREDSNVEYAQMNYKLYTNGIPADEKFSSQWELYNTLQVARGQKGIAGVDINVIPAWDITKGTKDVVVGILDTGIDIKNDEIKDVIYINQNEIPANGIDDDKNGYVDDVNGYDFVNNDSNVYDSRSIDVHGTFIAG